MPGASASPPAADPFSLIGTLLDRKYRVDRLVAHGGFGVVYRGHHLGLDSAVAIKVLKPAEGIDPDTWIDLLAQFLDEAKTLAKLRHPNVVGVLDAGVAQHDRFSGGVPWMVLEWLEGITLRDDLIARRSAGEKGRSPIECLDLVRPVLDAIADAHDAGIVHRDLKPSNIMLTPRRGGGVTARVLDFGIAKMMRPDGTGDAVSGDTATESHISSFTAATAAPEQLSGSRTGPWTDVFSLGLLITELLTDRSPLPTDDPNEHYRAVFDPQRPTPLKLGVDVGAWEPVLARALAVRPAERQASARELLADLEGSIDGAISKRLAVADSLTTSHENHPQESGFSATDRRAKEAAREAVGQTVPSARGRRPSPVRRWAGALAVVGVVGAGGFALTKVVAGGGQRAALVTTEAAPTRGCTSNKACSTSMGRAAICKRDSGVCVALESEDCTVSAEARDIDSNDTIWVGSMFPKTGPDAAEYGIVNQNAVELARRDFAQVLGGLPDDRVRPIGVIACDDAADAKRAATHLVDDVGVPAVIGFRNSIEAIELANATFVPRGTLAIAAINANPLVTTVPQPTTGPRLVWRTMYSNADAASAIGRLVEDVIEPAVRAIAPKTGTRVAFVRPKQAAGAAFSDALFAKLHFNGKSAIDNGNDFREITYDADAQEAQLGSVADALLAFRPSVVIYQAGQAVVRGVFAPLEAHWPSAVARPRYVSAGSLYSDVLDLIGRDATRRRRFFGVTPVADTPANARLVMHYSEVFPEKITRTISPNSTYDAFYFLAYASYAMRRDEPVTGARLAEAFARLVPPGRPVEVGLAGILEAYTALRNGESIDVTGSTGKLDFDLARGEAAFDHSILCVGVDATGRAVDGIPSGLTYVAATKKLEGELRCP